MFLPPFWSCFLSSDFSLHFHLLYKKLLRVVWCPLLLHHKYRTWHISALHSAASVYTVIHTPESAGTGNPTMTCQTLLIAFPVQILIPSSYLHILLGYIQGYEVPCWQICRCGISSHLGKDWVGAVSGGGITERSLLYTHTGVCTWEILSHNTREQNDCHPSPLLGFLQNSGLMLSGVEGLMHSQKGRSHLGCSG